MILSDYNGIQLSGLSSFLIIVNQPFLEHDCNLFLAIMFVFLEHSKYSL